MSERSGSVSGAHESVDPRSGAAGTRFVLPLPRLVFGPGAISAASEELLMLGVTRPLLLSDRGLECAGVVAAVMEAMPPATVAYLDVSPNPTVADADAAYAAYREGRCDGLVALGGGSVIDTAKFVAALAEGGATRAADLLGRPDRIGPGVAPLIAVPTTVGTGSESSPAAGLHLDATSRAVGTRSQWLVPRVAICDPHLVRTLPPFLVAATGIDALSHCVEGYFAEPQNPLVDAMALDGAARAFAAVRAAVEPDGEAARTSLMAAAFAGGVAIHKGLGPAHAVALACGDQHLHHGVLVAAALPLTLDLVASRVPEKAARLGLALGLDSDTSLSQALRSLNALLGLPATLREAGYRVSSIAELVGAMARSHFNRTSPYVPTREEYEAVASALVH